MRARDRADGAAYRAAGKRALIAAEGFDLAATIESGQVFHWEEMGDGGYAGTIGQVPVYVKGRGGECAMEAPAGVAELVREYFGLADDMEAICGTMPKGDAALEEAMAYAPGLRIIRQPSWECLATFITSSLKQVAHIRQISLMLRRRFGIRHEAERHEVFSYPAPGVLAAAGEAALRECGMGYRAKSLHQAAVRLAEGEVSLEELGEMKDDEELRAALCGFHGVGEKIADCVMLFGFGRLGAFPVDVWVERVLRERYGGLIGEGASLRRVREFAREYFGPFGGYAQQYFFHFARTGGGVGAAYNALPK